MRIVSVVLALICGRRPAPTRLLGAREARKVVFPTSCDSTVQVQFERGVAMLHSYWFTEARKVFDAVIQQDPSARSPTGAGRHYLGNSAGRGARAERHRGPASKGSTGARDRAKTSASATGSRGSAPTTAIPTRCR